MDMSAHRFKKEEALSDINQLLAIITEAHPDPYRNSGTQIMFYKKVDEIVKDLPDELDLSELQTIARKIVALIGDSHTFIENIGQNKYRVWLDFEPVDKKIILMDVYGNEFQNLIGYSLIAVNDVPLEEVKSKILEIRGANGIYNTLLNLSYGLKDPFIISYLTGHVGDNGESVCFTLMSLENSSIQKITVPFTQDPPGKLISYSSLRLDTPSESNIFYKIIEDSIAYLKIDSMTGYRESYESLRGHGATESFVRERLIEEGFDVNEEIEKVISHVPSASEIIIELLDEMRKMDLKDLIVDLRKNTGGNSYLTNILSYFLYGSKALEIDQGYDIERYSIWYEKQYGKIENGATIGGYNFEDMHKWLSGKRGMNREEWEEEVNLSPTFAKYEKNFEPHCGIKVYVLCSPLTFSAGFDLLDVLKRCGATIIGIPPAQPANAFTNVIPFSLSISGLRGGVSSKLMLKYPDRELFYCVEPDISVGMEDFKKWKWDRETVLLKILAIIGINRLNRTD